jgi:hypothetical protein
MVIIGKNDYVPQMAKVDSLKNEMDVSKLTLKGEKKEYLEKIGELCKQSGTRCFFAFGPIHESACKGEGDNFYKKTIDMIAAQNITILSNKQYCMKNDLIGDSSDHIAPEWKYVTTKYYADMLRVQEIRKRAE